MQIVKTKIYKEIDDHTILIDVSTKKYPEKYALLDKEDYPKVSQHKWTYDSGYVKRRDTITRKAIYLHRIIAGTPDDKVTDHINRDRLDNRKRNLRVTTGKNNSRNKGFTKNKKWSKYKGVTRVVKGGKVSPSWVMQINIESLKITESYTTEQAAAYRYDELAQQYFGEYACINGIDKPKEYILAKESTRGFGNKKYKGVYFHKRLKNRPWQAKVREGGKYKNLGYYTSEEEAYTVLQSYKENC